MSTEPGPVVETRYANARILTLSRPEALNALDPAAVELIRVALADAAADPACIAIVFTGEGRSFCAGADLKAARGRLADADGDAASARFVRSVSDLMSAIGQFPRPVIAAVQGLALAGGLELVLACDLVFAARKARFGDAHANFGLLPGGGGSARLPRRIGPTRAKFLMYTGDFLDAETMARWGLVNEVVEDEDLMPAVHRLLDRLATKSPIGLARMKRLVDEGLDGSLAQAIELEQRIFAEHAASVDRREGLAAFAERRAPRFVGR